MTGAKSKYSMKVRQASKDITPGAMLLEMICCISNTSRGHWQKWPHRNRGGKNDNDSLSLLQD